MFWCFRGSSAIDDADEQAEAATSMPVPYECNTRPISIAEFVPVRLTMKERKTQRLICGVILASSYTDKVDTAASVTTDGVKAKRRELVVVREALGALRGFVVADNIAKGAELITSKDFSPFQERLQAAIELARRYKIMNPDMMRTEYGKFLYLAQDLRHTAGCAEDLGFDVVSPIQTVRSTLVKLGIEELLADPRLPVCITPVPKIEAIKKLNLALRYKDKTVAKLCKEYAEKARVEADLVELIIRSLNDANNFYSSNVESVDNLLAHFKANFTAAVESSCANLAIREGDGGSRLTHEHKMQYHFVLQSLSLWRNISIDMYRLWMTAEEDILDPTSPYELRVTGQGLQRVQKSPRLYNAVSAVLAKTKRDVGTWVGSEKIHLGDDQVPNAFMFLDKYAQISRILIPILSTVAMLEKTENMPDHVRRYLDEAWRGGEGAKTAILADFFRHGFDGSGGDNMEDAGSCIDGRLTSAWNWCNHIRTKPFYPCFLMAGFSSFEGDLSV